MRWTRDELGVDHHTLRQALKHFSKKESLSQERLPSVEAECEGAGDVGYASVGSQASATGVMFPPPSFFSLPVSVEAECEGVGVCWWWWCVCVCV